MNKRVQIADLEVDLEARTVSRQGTSLDVRGLTFDLLAALIRRGGERATLQDLVDDVWQGEAITNEVITQRVRLLRRALDDDPTTPRYVETVRQKGYRLCAPIEQMAAATSAQDKSVRPVWLLVAGVAAAGVVLAALIYQRSSVPGVDPLVERARVYAASGQAADNLRAIDLFEQKLAATPEDYGASLGLSFALSQRVCRHEDNPELAQRARALAEQLLERDAADAEAMSALAYADDCGGNIDRALAGYLRAFELDSSQLDALASAAHLMQVKGDLAASLEQNLFVESQTFERPYRYVDIQIARCLELMTFDQAARARYARTVRLFPDNLFAAAANVRFLLSHGQLDKAREAATRSARLGARSADLLILQSELALLADRPEAATALLKEAVAATRTTSWPQTLLDISGASATPREALEKRAVAIRSSIDDGDLWPEVQIYLAVLLEHLGDVEGAEVALAGAVDHGFRDAAYLTVSPFYSGLRSLPGFDEQIRRIRGAASAQRDQALTATWWKAGLIDPDAL